MKTTIGPEMGPLRFHPTDVKIVHSVPCAYIFMENQEQNTYLRVFIVLEDRLSDDFVGPDFFLTGKILTYYCSR